MDLHRQHKMQGFTLLELLIVIILVSTLFVFAVDRLLEIRDQAERVSVQTVVGNLQSALALDLAEHVVKGRMQQIHLRINSNPMELLADTPINYRGEISHDELQKAKSGYWYYNTDKHLLTYLVSNRAGFESKLSGRARIRLKVVPVYDDLNKNRVFDHKTDLVKGVILRFQDPFSWKGLELYVNNNKNE